MKIRFLALTIICLSLVSCENPSTVQDINVIFHVQGKVVDAEDGSPIANAYVTIYLGYFGQSEFCTVYTDTNGEYKSDRCRGYTKDRKCWWFIEAGLNVLPEIYETSGEVALQCTSELQTINFALKRVSGDSQIQSDNIVNASN